MNLEEYYAEYGSRITQESERLFIDDFLYPLIGSKIERIIPQYPILDRTGRSRRIDFAYHGARVTITSLGRMKSCVLATTLSASLTANCRTQNGDRLLLILYVILSLTMLLS
jgi:hypothetical protein